MNKKNADIEKDLNVISPYIGGLWVESITGVIMLLFIGISGVYIFSNFCKRSDMNKNLEENPVIQKDIKDREEIKESQSSNQDLSLVKRIYGSLEEVPGAFQGCDTRQFLLL